MNENHSPCLVLATMLVILCLFVAYQPEPIAAGDYPQGVAVPASLG